MRFEIKMVKTEHTDLLAETVDWTKAWLAGQDAAAYMEKQVAAFFKA